MTKTLAVARWEYVERVKSKAFLIGLILTPLIMVGMGILPTLLATSEDAKTKAIGIIDASGEIAPKFITLMEERYRLKNGDPNYAVLLLSSGPIGSLDAAVADADAKVLEGTIEGYCVVTGTAATDTVTEYRSTAVGDFALMARMEDALRSIIAEKRALARGIDLDLLKELRVKMDLKTVKLSKTGEEEGDFLTVFFSAYVFMMMLFMLILGSGQILVRSVIEEKSNRIVEVLVSSCSPTELMSGKVLGLSLLGFTQIAFWALIGLGATLKFGIEFVPPASGLLLMVYFVLGYLFYAGVFIAAGSPLSTEQAAQQVTSYLVILLIIPIVLAMPAMKNPDATWITVLSFIPFLTPTMMALRLPIQMPEAWEIVSTIAIMLVSIYLVMVAAGRIFRIGILMTGRTPGIGEVLRWVRGK